LQGHIKEEDNIDKLQHYLTKDEQHASYIETMQDIKVKGQDADKEEAKIGRTNRESLKKLKAG